MKIKKCTVNDARQLVEKYHGYGGCGKIATYAFGVYENEKIVAAFLWLPPPIGAAKSISPSAHWGVLALSRMVAVPKKERELRHISKPLKQQMKRLIDRRRWPVLVTYSDEGQGHTGHVYKCSGWQKTTRSKRPTWEDANGTRVSTYTAGKTDTKGKTKTGHTYIQRWEHRVCSDLDVVQYMEAGGWVRSVVAGKFWKNGSQKHRIEQTPALFSRWSK